MSNEVRLAIYDLSHGLARSLSAQFLGGPQHAIDIIPHTSLLVYGKEYYFGGGIQSSDPGEFRRYSQLAPIDVQDLGHTSIPRSQFEAWCSSVTADGTFAPEAYNLLTRNCNHFSHEAALRALGLSRGVPAWILEVPSKFLASPMGMMVRPVLENMQLSGPGAVGGGGGGGGGSPFGGGAAPGTASAPPPMPAAAEANPWADIPVAAVRKAQPTPILDSHDRPLLSADASTVKVCVSKVTAGVDESDGIRLSLDELATELSNPNATLAHEVLEHTVPFLLGSLDGRDASSSTIIFSLMLLRLVVLHKPADDGARVVFTEIFSILGGKMVKEPDDESTHPLSQGHAARSMAWCTLSNAAGTDAGAAFLLRDDDVALLDALVDAAVMDSSPVHRPRAEVRQGALAFLYNVVHALSGGKVMEDTLPDSFVTLLCGTLDGIVEEADATAKLRRLLVAGKIVNSGRTEQGRAKINEAAKALVTDLGFVDVIASLRDGQDSSSDAKKVRELAEEICAMLS